MSDEHKSLGELPEDWTCKECGKPAWQYACCEPRSKMNCDDKASVGEYGTGSDQFAELERELTMAKSFRAQADVLDENAKLLAENVEANGRLDMQMKEIAKLREALKTIIHGGLRSRRA